MPAASPAPGSHPRKVLLHRAGDGSQAPDPCLPLQILSQVITLRNHSIMPQAEYANVHLAQLLQERWAVGGRPLLCTMRMVSAGCTAGNSIPVQCRPLLPLCQIYTARLPVPWHW